MLELQKFIQSNSDWELRLSQKPYCVTVKRKYNFIMFNYSQIDSDFFNPIVKECRGIILDDKFNTVCVPFFKFGNYGEGYSDNIDWATARVQEKIDGSLIKVWNYEGRWNVSTNGMIDAHDAIIQSDISPFHTFYDLFIEASNNSELDIETLNPNYSWMFEVVSPYNRVVVPYSDIKIYHIGTRNNKTLQEINIDIGITNPKEYGFISLNECVQMAKELPFSQEGYVVVDKNWRRNKVKSPAYVAAHHLKNNGLVTKSRIVALIRENEQDEFLNYYPEFQEAFDNVQIHIDSFTKNMDAYISKSQCYAGKSRKEFALFAKESPCPALLFNWLDKKCKMSEDWLWNQTDDKIVQWIGV